MEWNALNTKLVSADIFAHRICRAAKLSGVSLGKDKMRTIYLNGKYIAENEAKISIFDRGFLFADAVYEVVSVLDGKLIDFGGHMTRLTRSLRELGMKGAPDVDSWLAICRELVAKNTLVEGMIYWQVTRGTADDRSFYFPPEGTPLTVLAFTQATALVDNPMAKTGLSVVTLPDLRWGRADIKTTQLLYASMMKMEAKAQGADDAWMLRDGLVGEGTSQNAHIITQDGVLVTHQLDRKILHGITRSAVLKLANGLSLRFEERAFSVDEAKQAAEAFVSAASAFVLPVTKIDGHAIGDGKPGPITKQLREAYISWARETAI
jgi:D-alanine transaminase